MYTSKLLSQGLSHDEETLGHVETWKVPELRPTDLEKQVPLEESTKLGSLTNPFLAHPTSPTVSLCVRWTGLCAQFSTNICAQLRPCGGSAM